MHRIMLLAIGFFLLGLTGAPAEIYRCVTPAGELIMTDQQTGLPADCKPVEGTTGTSSFNVVPSVKEGVPKRSVKRAEKKAMSDVPDVVQWQSDASALVENYRDALRRRYRKDMSRQRSYANRRRAKQDISDLRQQKNKMLNGLEGSGLSRDQQNSARKTLDEIPKE